MLAQSKGGRYYTKGEIKEMLESSGFQYLETIKLGGPVSAIIARK